MLGLNLADLLYVIGMIELLLFGVGVWWLRCHIISHHCSLLCDKVCLAGCRLPFNLNVCLGFVVQLMPASAERNHK